MNVSSEARALVDSVEVPQEHPARATVEMVAQLLVSGGREKAARAVAAQRLRARVFPSTRVHAEVVSAAYQAMIRHLDA